VYSLTRDINHTPLKRQVDRYAVPNGYFEKEFTPQWHCLDGNRLKLDLFIDGYVLWSLLDKDEEKLP